MKRIKEENFDKALKQIKYFMSSLTKPQLGHFVYIINNHYKKRITSLSKKGE